MRAEIISIGDELMEGRVVDTNAPFAAALLRELGAMVLRVTTVPDRIPDIVLALEESRERGTGWTLVTGGLGPTEDDVTREAAARAFGRKLVRNSEALQDLEGWCAGRGRVMAPVDLCQADIPEGADLLKNPRGTAPGFVLGIDDRLWAFFPGVPAEAEPMIETFLSGLSPAGKKRPRRALSLFGKGESDVAQFFVPIRDRHRDLIIHYRAAFPTLEVIIEGDDEASLDAAFLEAAAGLEKWTYAREAASMPQTLAGLLWERGATLSLAESCSGGRAAHLATSVPGSSRYLLLAVVAYGNASKERVLGVPSDLLKEHGAVSAEVAVAMAQGVRKLAGSDWAASVTGIAGPEGGTPEKPVGLVHFAVAGPSAVIAHERHFNGFSREQIQDLAAHTCLMLLIRRLKEGQG